MKHSVRFLSLALCLCLLCSLLPLTVTYAETYGDLTYGFYDGQVTIVDCNTSASGDLVIPDTIEGYPVTSIGHEAFYRCTSLTGVTIPDSVTSIGEYAFSWCNNLTDVTIPDSVTSIGDGAFSYCDRLISVTIPDSVTSIENGVFSYCDRLTSVTIPDSVTSIGYKAFYNCGNLISVTIPDSVTSIGYEAFYNCGSLTSVTIGDSVTSIGNRAFYWCDSLISVTIPDSITSIGERVFSYCTSLTNVTISDSVTSIGKDAFNNCNSLTSVTIPDSVTSIGECAFSFCSSLTTVIIPDSVTSIGKDAFSNCTKLNYKIYDNGKYLGNEQNPYVALMDTTNTRIAVCHIHPDTKVIGDFAFNSCTSLTSVTIPDSVTSIGDSAFYNCGSLTSVTIPDSVTSIGGSAFSYCNELTNVYITSLENWCNIDFGGPFSNYLRNGKKLYLNGELVKNLVIPQGITQIKDYAFYSCDSLTSITIPDSVTSIGDEVFYNCVSLDDIYFTGNAPSFGERVFSDDYATLWYHAGTTGWDTVTSSQLTGFYYGSITLQETDHFFFEYTYDNNHTCTADGTERAVCPTCGEIDVREANGTAAHRYVDGSCLFCDEPDPNPNRAICTGTLTAYGTGKVLLTLTPVGETEPAATLTTIDGSYSLAVAPGEYILTASQEGTVTRTYTLTLTEGETAQEIKLACPGDVSGDGRLNVGDVAKIYAHAKRTAEFADDYQLLCADYNGDGRINVGDAARVYALIKSK